MSQWSVRTDILTFLTYTVDVLTTKNQTYSRIISVTTKPFVWLGRNPLAIFVLMDLLAIFMIKYIIIDDKSAWSHFYHYAFATWISNKEVASTVFSLFFAILWTIIAAIMFRYNIFIRLWKKDQEYHKKCLYIANIIIL